MNKQAVIERMDEFLSDFGILSKLMARIRFNGACWEVEPDGNQCSSKHRYARIHSPKHRERLLAHRYIYAVMTGQIVDQLPENLVVMHSCDNPACVFPGHLSLGTQSKNLRDAWQRTRSKR